MQDPPRVQLRPGDRGAEVAALVDYLRRYGYLTVARRAGDPDVAQPFSLPVGEPVFDDEVIVALRRFQTAFDLPLSDWLTPETLRFMQLPRCGVPDRFPEGGEVAFQQARWTTNPLLYRFANLWPGLSAEAIFAAANEATTIWSQVIPLAFVHVVQDAHIRIAWFSGSHAGVPDIPFDGPGHQLGHAWGPADPWRGELHLDADETWSVDTPASGNADLVTQLVHELGHVLGLDHSTDASAIMFPTFENGEVKRRLAGPDVAAIQQLYGAAEVAS